MANPTNVTHNLNCAKLMPNGPHECSCGSEAAEGKLRDEALLKAANQRRADAGLPVFVQEESFGASTREACKHELSCNRIDAGLGRYYPKRECTCRANDPDEMAKDYVDKMASPNLGVRKVHNHGPNSGRGLDCPEYTLANGQKRGHCCLNAEERVELGFDTPAPRPATVPPVASEDLAGTLTQWWVQRANEEAHALVPKAVEYGGAHRAQDLLDTGARMADLLGLKDQSEGQLQELAIYFYLVGKFGRWTAALKEGRSVSDDTLLDIGIYVKMAQRVREVGGWPL